MSRAYAITAEAIAAERARVDDDLDRVDIARVIALDRETRMRLKALGYL